MESVEELLRYHDNDQLAWKSFCEKTKEDIATIENKQKDVKSVCTEIEETISTVKTLSKDARLTGYVKISPLCHIFATIKHTGEYNVHFSETYQAVLTQQQTLDYLEKKKKDVEFDLEVYENQIEQLAKRLNIEGGLNVEGILKAEGLFGLGEEVPLPDLKDMPEQIESDVGVALKNDGFYEIIEVEESTPFVHAKDRKRISRVPSIDV